MAEGGFSFTEEYDTVDDIRVDDDVTVGVTLGPPRVAREMDSVVGTHLEMFVVTESDFDAGNPSLTMSSHDLTIPKSADILHMHTKENLSYIS